MPRPWLREIGTVVVTHRSHSGTRWLGTAVLPTLACPVGEDLADDEAAHAPDEVSHTIILAKRARRTAVQLLAEYRLDGVRDSVVAVA